MDREHVGDGTTYDSMARKQETKVRNSLNVINSVIVHYFREELYMSFANTLSQV